MIFIPVFDVVLLILGLYLKWLNDYGKPKKRQDDLKNALEDFKNQLNIKK